MATRTPANIRVAIAGLGNCAGALIEGISCYRQSATNTEGLLFPRLCVAWSYFTPIYTAIVPSITR